MNLEMTKEESGVLLQIIDGFIKAYGLNGGESAIVFAKRIIEMQKFEGAKEE